MKADSICENECPSESKSEELSPSTSIHVSTRPTAQSGLFEEIEIFLRPRFSNVSVEGSHQRGPRNLLAMITSNSGCDLRPPTDTYAFKCKAKQCSLEVALTASCCAACAFLQRDCDLYLRALTFFQFFTH